MPEGQSRQQSSYRCGETAGHTSLAVGSGQGANVTICSARFTGSSAAIVSAVDLVRGVGVLLGWTRIDVPGAHRLHLDTDYQAKGKYGVAALKDNDLVCVHVEAPDEASHEGKADAKVRALEEIDRRRRRPVTRSVAGLRRMAHSRFTGSSYNAPYPCSCLWHGAIRDRRNRSCLQRTAVLRRSSRRRERLGF